MKSLFLIPLLWVTLALPLAAQQQTREEYILKYKELATETMERYGIPASIVMAQALLESGNGNSRLAREANNHFGIKCGSAWRGESLAHDDDAPDECFRVYGSVEESFLDHGRFLDDSPRYQRLFDLAEDDYAGWAEGLRACGYATNPNYGAMLIKIIEDNRLYLLDQGVSVDYADIRPEQQEVVLGKDSVGGIPVDQYTVTIDLASGRELRFNNGVPYVEAQAGDTFASIARDFRMSRKRLLKLNDLSGEFDLHGGDALYVGKKLKRSPNTPLNYVVKPGDTMHSISQQYALRLKNLLKINKMTPDSPIREGQQIRLR
ncbi:MAG: glucosaminidase domain-containing protein [Rikenellaceae bacterium]|jgi:LysM repeat protein|nr:glucosaminidase domain-containing protein [Rikenellaceae bacterium]